MPTDTPARTRAALAVEQLEAREVPTTFGANQGLSIAVGNVIQTTAQDFGEFAQDEVVTGSGPGTRAQVQIFNQQGTRIYNFFPFGQFRGGVYVQVADVDGEVGPNGERIPELIVSTGPGTTGRVKVYSFSGGGLRLLANFTPFGPNYTGGVQLAAANVTGGLGAPPNAAEIIVGTQSGGSVVKVFGYDPTGNPPSVLELRRFQAFENGFTGGVSLAAGNVTSLNDPDFREIIVGRYTGRPEVRIFDAELPTVTLINRFFAWNPANPFFQGGVNVQAGPTDGTIGAQIYVNLKGTSRIRIFEGFTGSLLGTIRPFGVRVTSVSMAIGQIDFPPALAPQDNINDLIVVAGNGPFAQRPVVFPGAINSAAGLNGSFRL
jgi:hypothetical protein